ncbi:MAG: head-tail adaptor protein [Sulfuricurvum sp.]
MRSGKLRHKIQILTISGTQDNYGGLSEVETLLNETMSEIKPIGGGERFMSNQVFPEATSQILCRYVPGVTTKHKIKFVDRYFDILNVQNKDERNVELIIIAKETL